MRAPTLPAVHPGQAHLETTFAGTVARAMRAVDHLAWWIEYQTAPSRSRNLRPCRAPSSATRTRPTYDGEARTPSRSEGR